MFVRYKKNQRKIIERRVERHGKKERKRERKNVCRSALFFFHVSREVTEETNYTNEKFKVGKELTFFFVKKLFLDFDLPLHCSPF